MSASQPLSGVLVLAHWSSNVIRKTYGDRKPKPQTGVKFYQSSKIGNVPPKAETCGGRWQY